MNKKIKFLIIILLAAIGFGIYYYLITKTPSYITVPVQKGTIIQEVSTSGSVEPPATINLYFKTSGKLADMDVRVGDTVEANQVLAKQEMKGFDSALAQSQSGVKAAQAQLDQLLAGASAEDIDVYKTAAANAQTSLASARQAHDNVKQSAVNAIKDALAKADDAVHNRADRLFNDPTGPNPSFGITVSSQTFQFKIEADTDTKITIGSERKNIEDILKSWKAEADGNFGDLSESLNTASRNLQIIQKMINSLAEVVNGYNSTSITDDAVYQNYRTDILTARTNLNAALENITGAEGSLAGADAKVQAAEGTLKSAQDQLAAQAAPARQSDAAVYIARINQARAAETQVEQEIQDLSIVAPARGIVAKTNGNPGEILNPGSTVISLIPESTLEVKLNVSEDTITGVKAGQKVIVTLDALGNQPLTGKVVSIEPSGTIISGAVYYQTTVMLDEVNPLIRPDMSANAMIETAVHDNALTVPVSAIQSSGGAQFVQVLEAQNVINKNVETGVESGDGMIEIVSGLTEGDKVILGTQ